MNGTELIARKLKTEGVARLTLEALVGEVKSRVGEPGREERKQRIAAKIVALKEEWLAEWTPLLTSGEQPLTPYRVIHAIDGALDRENSIVTHDAGATRDR